MERVLLLVFLFIFLVLASMKRWKLAVIVSAALFAAALAFIFLSVRPGDDSASDAPVPVLVRHSTALGEVLDDPDFSVLMRRSHQLEPTAKRLLTSGDATDAATLNADAIWFSDLSELKAFLAAHPDLPERPRAVFTSPMVLFTWPDIASALARQDVIRPAPGQMDDIDAAQTASHPSGDGSPEGASEITGEINTKKHSGLAREWRLSDANDLLELISANRTWASLGLRQQEGNVTVFLPAANTPGYIKSLELLGRKTPPPGSLLSIGATDRLFADFIWQGQWAFPLIISDERPAVQARNLKPKLREKMEEVVVIRTEKTVERQFICRSLSEIGDRFVAALREPETVRLISQTHGLKYASAVASSDAETADGDAVRKAESDENTR